MEPRLMKAFKAMEDLEKGAIANPDKGTMVGRYWLRNPKLSLNSFLRLQIENTLESICAFAEDIIGGKIKPPSFPDGRFTHILSVGIGGSALGPQFVAEALAPDNPPLKVLKALALLMALQNAPPGLDYERDKKFSKSFKDLVAACLVKDPKKRPSSEKLLKHPFFKMHEQLSIWNILFLMAKEAELLMQNKELYGEKEHLSQQDYIRGISAWNFNLEELKNKAALIQDYDEISNTEELNANSKQENGPNDVGLPAERLSPDISDHSDNGSHHE
ncbi:hypothetical protein L2E82_44666 [Cichorium intybus]|uniref:Uncharacterized protein n=1 Tax=Cichorium intybus TaxID=13427 RepID=A0ACB8ZRE0_CICIN|nr:hypothetical protein L2E82_44666 [Cichorium intybus]